MSTPKRLRNNSSEGTAQHARPTSYAREIADEICDRIVMGESVRQITLLKHMPAESSIYRWLMQHDDFRKNYEIAKGLQAYRFGEELLEIADDSRNDWIEREDARTGKVTLVPNRELVERARLRVHARQWLMAKHAPRKYGDKVELEHSGKIDSNVMVLSEKQRAEIIKRRRAAVEFGKS